MPFNHTDGKKDFYRGAVSIPPPDRVQSPLKNAWMGPKNTRLDKNLWRVRPRCPRRKKYIISFDKKMREDGSLPLFLGHRGRTHPCHESQGLFTEQRLERPGERAAALHLFRPLVFK